MILYVSLFLLGIAALLWWNKSKGTKTQYLVKETKAQEGNVSGSAVNIETFKDKGWLTNLKEQLLPVFNTLGEGAWLKLLVFLLLISGAGISINNFMNLDSLWLPLVIFIGGVYFGFLWLKDKRKAKFEREFPDALNIMMSSIGAGESVMQAMCYVGKTLDNEIGKTFRDMGDRLQLGEPTEQVFNRATGDCPYPSFIFFIVTIRANISRGGQLKPVMSTLIRVLMEARTIDKKKVALTSEARLSAKIVGSMPILFMLLLNYLNPDNLHFLMTDPDGVYIMYYVLGSEFLGMFIIWMLIRKVR